MLIYCNMVLIIELCNMLINHITSDNNYYYRISSVLIPYNRFSELFLHN